ncbi:hypothetical protein Fcan01_16930 [Folsomia candida]|uniref:Gustatory receptor n=1 Tax=Folsomia candida TaxID=158441 RepID=A0A226DQT8_FOLCA|nr:hypothetical protein Fcan01_16930 [Folsomia candida]
MVKSVYKGWNRRCRLVVREKGSHIEHVRDLHSKPFNQMKEAEQNIVRTSLLQLLFINYYPFGYKPCVEIDFDKRGSVSVRKSTCNRMVSGIPHLCMGMAWFFCGFAIVAVALESKTYLEMVMIPKVWTWTVGVLLASSGIITYKVWILDSLDLPVKMANELITIEKELLAELPNSRWEYSNTHFRLIDYLTIILYLTPPIVIVAVVNAGSDPFVFLVQYFLKFDSFFSLVKHVVLPGYGKVFQVIALVMILWPVYNFIFYELVRILLLNFITGINAGQKSCTILHCLQKQMQNRAASYKKYFLDYSRFRIISQSVDHALRISMLLLLIAIGMVTCATTFIIFRLHGQYSTGMVVINGCGTIGFNHLLDMLLRIFGRCDDMCRNFLQSSKNPGLLGRMSCHERRVYLRVLAGLPRWILIGRMGQFTLIRVTKESKADADSRVAAGSKNAARYPTRYPQSNYPYPCGYPLPATRYEN